jgi:hypothetical protein
MVWPVLRSGLCDLSLGVRLWYLTLQLSQRVTVTNAEPVSGVPSLSVAVTVMV